MSEPFYEAYAFAAPIVEASTLFPVPSATEGGGVSLPTGGVAKDVLTLSDSLALAWGKVLSLLPAGTITGQTIIYDDATKTYSVGLVTKAGIISIAPGSVAGTTVMTIPESCYIDFGQGRRLRTANAYLTMDGGYFQAGIVLVGGINDNAALGTNLSLYNLNGNGRIKRSFGTALAAGNATLNYWRGIARFPVGSKQITIQNNYVLASSYVTAHYVGASDDTTMLGPLRCHVAAANSFTINAPQTATGEVAVLFEVHQ